MMSGAQGVGSPPPYKPEELEELQRGQEQPLTLEGMERPGVEPANEVGGTLVLDPGNRPGAVKLEGQDE